MKGTKFQLKVWKYLKNIPKGGPDGGDGGDGGNVIIRAVNNLNTLSKFRYQRKFEAKNGKRGGSNNKTGSDGEDLIIDVPCGTLLYDLDTDTLIKDLVNNQDEITICKGGKGGFGNLRYKSSTNRSPTKFTEGKDGEFISLKLELRLLADIGLLGMPNAGKSSLVRAVSSARPKVADYPFTTLHPSLGVVDYSDNSSFVISDIPGLIAGASSGVGLGIQFLKHLSRTKVIVQMVDIYEKSSSEIIQEVKELLIEIRNFDKRLTKRIKWLVLNKKDLVDRGKLEILKTDLQKHFKDEFYIYCISAAKKEGTQTLMRDIGEYMELTND